MEKNSLIIREIVKKENERYELDKLTGFPDLDPIITSLIHSLPDLPDDSTPLEFNAWRENLLSKLYSMLNYTDLFHRQQQSRHVYMFTRRLFRNSILNIRRKHSGMTLDDELKIKSGKIAYKLSVSLFADLYPAIVDKSVLITTPMQLEERCVNSSTEYYPIDCPRFLTRLHKKDNEFWNETVDLMRTLTRYIANEYNFTTQVKSEIVEDVALEASLSVQQQLCTGKLDVIDSGCHLRNSLRKTCEMKLYEYMKKNNRSKDILLDESQWEKITDSFFEDSILEPHQTEETERERFLYLMDVDINNSYELAVAIVDVLCYGKGTIYNLLVGKYTEQVETLMLHIYQKKSYEEIIRLRYGVLSKSEELKQSNKLRQSVVRIKDTLKKQMKIILELLKENKLQLK